MYACTEPNNLSSGLHKESLEAAEKQVALICELLKGVRVPLTLSMMQVCFLSFVPALRLLWLRYLAASLHTYV